MSVQILERNQLIAETTDSLINLWWSRSDREFWREAWSVPPSDWPAWRDERIERIFSEIRHWRDPWREAVPGIPYPFARGMGTTYGVLSGDTFSFFRVSAKRNVYPFDGVFWKRGDPIPDEIGYSADALRAAWDALYQENTQ